MIDTTSYVARAQTKFSIPEGPRSHSLLATSGIPSTPSSHQGQDLFVALHCPTHSQRILALNDHNGGMPLTRGNPNQARLVKSIRALGFNVGVKHNQIHVEGVTTSPFFPDRHQDPTYGMTLIEAREWLNRKLETFEGGSS